MGVYGGSMEKQEIKKTYRTEDLKNDLLKRLSRIEGQIRGLLQMVEDDRYCDDILVQIAASKGALSAVSNLVLENHLKNCLVRDISQGESEILDELMDTIRKMNK